MNIKRIFHYYWESTKQYKWYFFGLLFVYSVAVVLSNIFGPLIFKSIIDTISKTLKMFAPHINHVIKFTTVVNPAQYPKYYYLLFYNKLL